MRTPQLLRDLKTAAATDTLGSELARLRRAVVAAAGADHPQLPDAVAALLGHIDVYRCDYQGLARSAAQRAGRNRSCCTGISPAVAGAGRGAGRRRRTGHPAAAAVRRGDRQVRRGLPVLPRRPAGLAQRGRRRAAAVRRRRRGIPPHRRHPRPAVAAGDDDADHPRHQTRRGCPGPDRGAVAGAVAVGRIRRPLGRPDPLPRHRDRIVPVAEHLRGMAGRRRGHRRAARPAARLHREGDPGSGARTPRGTTRTPNSRMRCIAGWTRCSTDRWPRS